MVWPTQQQFLTYQVLMCSMGTIDTDRGPHALACSSISAHIGDAYLFLSTSYVMIGCAAGHSSI